jgi:hypothetical protein
MYEQKVDWFVLREGVYGTLKPDAGRILRSEAFPGLWLDPATIPKYEPPQLLAETRGGCFVSSS